MTERFIARTRDGRTQRLTLGKVIHKGGGAGRIMAISGDRANVVKLYHDASIAASYEAKLTAMLERPPALPPIEDGTDRYVQIAWPSAIVEDGNGTFRGFVMPFIDLSTAAPLETLLVKALRKHHGLPENYAYRVFAAQNVAAAVAELHRHGHHIIDLKPQNLSIYKKSMYVAVVDCDGLSINGGEDLRFPAGQFTDGYRAPETVSRRLDPDRLGEDQDRFALAVVLFQLLNNGIHPFQGVPVRPGDALGSEQERINAGLYPYGSTGNARQAPSPGSLHLSFEPETVEMFRRAFDSEYRPAAHEWCDHLRGLIGAGTLTRCERNPAEHAHFSRGCGLCTLASGQRKRAAKTRQRVRKQVATQRRHQPRTRKTYAPGRGYRVVVRTPSSTATQSSRTTPPAILASVLGKVLTGLGRLVFGSRTQPVTNQPAGTASVVVLCAVYGLFFLNLMVLLAIATSFMTPRSFYDINQFLIDSGAMTELESLSRRQRLQALQAYAASGVVAVTVIAQFGCEWLRRAAAGSFVGTHAQWLTYTFWLTPPLAMLSVLIGMLTWPYGLAAIVALPFWWFHRLSKGLKALFNGRPILAPTAII